MLPMNEQNLILTHFQTNLNNVNLINKKHFLLLKPFTNLKKSGFLTKILQKQSRNEDNNNGYNSSRDSSSLFHTKNPLKYQ
jgi:hypothetical protein